MPQFLEVPLTPKQKKDAAFEEVDLGPGSHAGEGDEPTDRSASALAADVVTGAAKGLGSTVYGLGKVVHDYTPIGRISDAIQPGAFDSKPAELEPAGTAQKVGYGAEQLGEFFVPGGAAGRFAKAGEALKAGVVTLAQTGSPGAAGTSAALTAAIPGGGAAKKLAGSLQEGAEKSVAQALGATKEWAKADARRIAPEMLERGVKGTRAAMLDRAEGEAAKAGKALEAAYTAAAQTGQSIDGNVVRGTLQLTRDSLTTAAQSGKQMAIPGSERVIKRLDRLDAFVADLGPDIPVDQAAHIKRTLDQIVSKSGLYGQKAGANATDAAEAWATREAAGAFRGLLENVPDVAALNKEYRFWAGLKNVLRETEKRTQAQSGGLQAGITAAAGGASGFASGDNLGDSVTRAFAGAAAGRQFVKLVQSPYWRTAVSGPLKAEMAKALASGSAGHATSVAKRMVAALPSEARLAFAQ